MKVDKIPFKKKLALQLFKQYRANQKKIHELNYIFWECTLRCNLKCIHCGSDCKKEANVPDMPAEDFLGAIDDVTPIVTPNKTTIVITGGEPTLRKDLEEIGQQLYNRGFPWGMVSNGLQLTPQRMRSLLQAGLRSLTISLDGPKEAHNWMRGNSKSFDRAWQAVQMSAQIPHLEFDVVTCVNQENIDHLLAFKEMLIAGGVKRWRIFTIFPIGRAKQTAKLKLSPKQFKALFDFMAETKKEGRIDVNFGCEGYLGNYEKEVRDNFFFCHAGVNVASILVDGSISACPNLRSNFSQGNIRTDSFRTVWETQYKNMRDRQWMKMGKCKDCKQFSICEGNGMHLRDGDQGDVLFCHYEYLKEAES